MTIRSTGAVVDFDGSLQLARLSWESADELDPDADGRRDLVVAALVGRSDGWTTSMRAFGRAAWPSATMTTRTFAAACGS